MANNVTDLGKVGMTPKGAYNSATTYERLDVVTYEGSSYVSLVDSNTNNNPSTATNKWQLMAAHGEFTEAQLEEFKAAVVAASEKEMDEYTDTKKGVLDDYTDTKKTELNTYTGTKKTELDTYTGGLKTDFNDNATNKTTTFNTNATNKTTDFDTNVTNKTKDFNDNASSKTDDFNNNATAKTTAFDEHVDDKTDEFDEHTEEMQQEIDELSANMPWDTTEQATEISVDDAAKYSRNKLELFGNAEQDNTKMTYKCDGTETGDYYLTYDSTNYYFTMPTITEGDILVFDTADLKLYLADTEITTESTGTGTNLTFIASPNPDYPQDIHVVTGNNTVKRTGKNLLDLTNAREEGTFNGITCTKQDDGTYTFVGTSTSSTVNFYPLGLFANYNTFTDYESFDKSKILFDLAPGTYTVKDIVLFMVFENNTRMATSLNIETGGVNTFTLTQTGHVIALRTPQCENGKTYDIVLYPQLEKSSTATSFEQYHLEEYQVNLGDIELCKIGDYQDYLYKENGNWYKYGAIDKLVLTNSSGNWTKGSLSNETYSVFQANFATTRYINKTTNIFSDKFLAKINTEIQVLDAEGISTNGGALTTGKPIRISILNSRLSSADATGFKTWLKTNNVTAYIPLYTPTSVQITDETLISQLDAIYEHLKLVKGTNNITITAEDLAPYMQLNYMQDQQKKFENIINSTYTNVMEGEY